MPDAVVYPEKAEQISKFASTKFSLSNDRAMSLDDYLYLPSNLTYNRREEMVKWFGA